MPEGHPRLVIAPDWANSWFIPPPIQNHPDTIGYWPMDKKFPYVGSETARVPDEYKDTISIRFLFQIEDSAFKKYMEARKVTDKNDNIRINPGSLIKPLLNSPKIMQPLWLTIFSNKTC